MFEIGEKVTYVTPYKKEKGIVKSISDAENTFVVYNCGGEWDNYKDYTAARTSNKDLIKGWADEYARKGLGSMTFYDQLSDYEKRLCKDVVDQIESISWRANLR